MNKNKAFTLTELVIVIAIIGIGTAVSLSFNSNRTSGDLLKSSAKAHDLIYRINNVVTYTRLLSIMERKNICVKLTSVNSTISFAWCSSSPTTTATRSGKIKKKLEELFASKRYPSDLVLPGEEIISFTPIGVPSDDCSKGIVVEDKLEEGVGTRYEILRISRTGISRFCRSSDIGDKCI